VTRLLNHDLSIEELKRNRWSARPGGETRLLATARELRRKPIRSLTVEDMRWPIRQDLDLAYIAAGDRGPSDQPTGARRHVRGRSAGCHAHPRAGRSGTSSPNSSGRSAYCSRSGRRATCPKTRGKGNLGLVAHRQQLPSSRGRRVVYEGCRTGGHGPGHVAPRPRIRWAMVPIIAHRILFTECAVLVPGKADDILTKFACPACACWGASLHLTHRG
jgi:hypothetical protein